MDKQQLSEKKYVIRVVLLIGFSGLLNTGGMAMNLTGIDRTKKDTISKPLTGLKDKDWTFNDDDCTEAEFQGGPAAWLRFLNKNLHYPEADTIEQSYCLAAKFLFLVDTTGKINDIKLSSECVSELLKKEIIRVLKLSSGQWKPATFHGHKVEGYKVQPFSILLSKE